MVTRIARQTCTVFALACAFSSANCGSSSPDPTSVDAGPGEDAIADAAPSEVASDAADAGAIDLGVDSGPVDAGPVLPTLSDIQAKIFTPTCAVGACHTTVGASLSGGLDLSSTALSYAGLVNVPSHYQGWTTTPRVDPGKPTNSFLVVKLSAAWTSGGADGTPMPYLPTPLPAQQVQAVEDWISAGALND
jgi:hypothetical protein